MELLVCALIAIAAISGCFSGVVIYDLRDRKKSRDELADAGKATRETVAKIQEAHNSMAQQLIQLQDKVQAQELRIGLKK